MLKSLGLGLLSVSLVPVYLPPLFLFCVKVHNLFLSVLIICPCRIPQPGECWWFCAVFMVLFSLSFVPKVETPSRICIQKCYVVCAPKSYKHSAVYGDLE